MVIGLETFKKYFDAFPDNYVVIGGTACDIIIEDAGLTPRATKDIDIILVVEALNADFVRQFWTFIEDGKYERKEKSADERKYYRFSSPGVADFPLQIELFSRNPDLLDLHEGTHLTPIPVDDDLSSLSAILLNDGYYHYIIEHSTAENGLRKANIEALICLKAKAYLDIEDRIKGGGSDDSKQLKKHKADVFRLVLLTSAGQTFELHDDIKSDLQLFTQKIENDLPAKDTFKAMGVATANVDDIFTQLKAIFELT
ncbi:MAG: hypothetical protein QHC79_25515 [Pseudosphingobacterium sp.]|nr:hypothetical protein [Pseudosphingobacterium sp.]